MATKQGYQAALDQPLPFPEDPEMTYMTVKIEEDIRRPPGVHSLRQWGSMTMAEGKHKNKTFKLASDWALSFQHFVIKAWDQSRGQQCDRRSCSKSSGPSEEDGGEGLESRGRGRVDLCGGGGQPDSGPPFGGQTKGCRTGRQATDVDGRRI